MDCTIGLHWSWFVHGSSMPSVHHARPLIVSNLLCVQLLTHSSLTHTRLCIVLAGSDNKKKKYQSKFADHIGHRRKWIRLLIKNRMKRSFLIHLMDQQLSPHSATIQTLVVPVLMVYRPNFMFSPPFFFFITLSFSITVSADNLWSDGRLGDVVGNPSAYLESNAS